MKNRYQKNHLFAAITLAGFAFTTSSAFATDLYWDGNGDTAGAGTTPTGTWGTDLFWNITAAGDVTMPTNAPTTSVDDLYFSAGTDATDPYTVTVDATRDARLITIEEGTPTFSGGTLINLGADGGITVAADAGDPIFTTPVTLGTTNTITVADGRNLALDGVVTGALVKAGDGTVTLSGTPIHALTPWTVNGGTLVLHTGGGEVIPGGTVNNGGTVQLAASNRVNNSADFTINEGGTFDTNGQGDLIGKVIGAGNIINSNSLAPVQTLQVNPNGGTATFSGVIADPLNFYVNGSGTQILSGLNTYTGSTQIRQGNLSINSIGDTGGGASAIGAPTTGGAILIGNAANTGTLIYTGTGHSSNRQIRVGTNSTTPASTNTGGATITANGESDAALVFTNGTFNAQTNATTGVGADRVLTLQGTSIGLNTISGIIRDNLVTSPATGTAKVSLTKAQAGTWVLTNNNTYTGNTTISGGNLRLSGGGRLGGGNYAGAIAIDAGATFQLGGASQTLTGVISGDGTLIHSGTGQTILQTATNSFGALTVSTPGGRVFINTFASLPSAATVSVTDGNLVFQAGAQTYNNAIAVGDGGALTARNASVLTNVTLPGTGSVIFQNDDANTNLLTITNNQTLSGALTVQVGGVRMGVATMGLGEVEWSGNISGSGSLVVASSGNFDNNPTLFGKGVLTLSGANNTYAGDTTVSKGTLRITQATNPLNANTGNDASTVTIADTEAKLELTYVGTDKVDKLFIGITEQGDGVYGHTDSGADNGGLGVGALDAYFGPGTGTLTVGGIPTSPYDTWALAKGLDGTPGKENGKADDPDKDGLNNLQEFAFDGNPLSGANDGKVVGKVATVSAAQVLTLTLPVRDGAVFGNDGGDQLSGLVDGIYYRIEGGTDLVNFAATITEVTNGDEDAIQAVLPPLSTGWSYRTFRTSGTVSTVPKDFMRARISETP